MIWRRSELTTVNRVKIIVSQILLGEGDWGELPGSSGIFFDVRFKLVSTYQYHQDFYFSEETFLKVKSAPVKLLQYQ